MDVAIEARLEQARKELLDLGLRNSLLNYRTRSNRIDVVDELSDQVFRLLVAEGKSMHFGSFPGKAIDQLDEDLLLTLGESDQDWSSIFAIDVDENSQSAGGIAARHVDKKLQTKLAAESLLTRLLKIHRAARTFLEEQGVNTLYLALGFLHWYESPSSEIVRNAPLILVPVDLQRTSAKARFRIKYNGDELSTNLSLAEKLKDNFGISFPEIEGEDLDVVAYQDAVRQAVAGQDRWEVAANEVCLGFFSFGKFLMYKDLELSTWPEDFVAPGSDVLSALLGDGFGEPSSDESMDNERALLSGDISIHQVVDADSSQTMAIGAVQQGNSLVIQGPPGTGKSQTITNLIAECLANDKTVLFVAEKMAALEVVKRRLDQIDLGDSVLELHSHKTNKKALLKELHRTLDLGKPKLKKSMVDLERLSETQARLDDYATAINEPVNNSGYSPSHLIGQRKNLLDAGTINLGLQIEGLVDWSWPQIQQKLALVRQFSAVLKKFGVPVSHPFYGSNLRVLLPTDEANVAKTISRTLQSLQNLIRQGEELSSSIQLHTPSCVADVELIVRAAQRAIEAPHLEGVRVNSAEWQVRRDDLKSLCASGRRMFELTSARKDELIEEAWSSDVLGVREALVNYVNKWWRFLSSDYRAGKKRLAGICKNGLPSKKDEFLPIVEDILEYQRAARSYEPLVALGAMLYGAQWQGPASDWDVLEGLTDWIISLYDEIGEGKIPDGITAFLEGNPKLTNLSGLAKQVSEAVSSYVTTKGELSTRLEIPKEFLNEQTFTEAEAKLDLLQANIGRLHEVADYNIIVSELREAGLQPLVEKTACANPGEIKLETAVELEWVESLLQIAYRSRKSLQRFNRARHEEDVKEFRKLDSKQFFQNRALLAKKHWDSIPSFNAGEVAIIRREINRKRGHMPIRRLLNEAGRAIQQFKPVFMMSPMSIANFLQPGGHSFDVVVFDEASQVKPVDAFGAVLRGKQVVVVGDDKQMPPSNFFDSVAGAGDEEDDSIVADMESILGLFISQGCPQSMLRWHYRSQDDSLIAVSNFEFYNSKLVLFPSPGNHPTARGLQFLHLQNTAYDRGKTRTNPREAQAIALEVMKHAKTRPRETLGVVAFSKVQRDAIEMQLELLRRKDESCERFFAESHDEPFFIKNLENVQGDERDTIYISVGYGKTKEGYMAMDFGPVNRDGGERRLNVLISRARKTCRVFANFESGDLDLKRSSQRGVAVLKAFLNYAQNRVLDVPDLGSDLTDSPFEDSVIIALRKLGYEIRPQVGSGGFKIDIGVVDPEKPGSYLIGIECDGATYHSAKWARDRDRLREEVLKRLGWRIHRIWSTDYFRSPDKEIRRTVEAIERAKKNKRVVADQKASNPIDKFRVERMDETRSEEQASLSTDYVMATPKVRLADKGLHELSIPTLAKHIETVVDIESPVHKDEVLRRIMSACGVGRAGSRIQSTYESALTHAIRSGKRIKKKKEFLWSAAKPDVQVRNREGLDNASRNIELVAPEEIDAALREVVEQSHSIRKDELLVIVASSFGIQRVTTNIKAVINKRLLRLLKAKELNADGDLVFQVSGSI